MGSFCSCLWVCGGCLDRKMAPLPQLFSHLVLVYGVAVGRAVYKAWVNTAARSAANKAGDGTIGGNGVTVDEALKILDVPQTPSLEDIDKSFKHIYEANAQDKGNSFYLQSKVYRAHESLTLALKTAAGEAHDDSDLRPAEPEESEVKNKQ